jgi:hypothetical protein
MKASPEVVHGLMKAAGGSQAMQRDDVTARDAARVTSEVSVDERDGHRRIALAAPFV